MDTERQTRVMPNETHASVKIDVRTDATTSSLASPRAPTKAVARASVPPVDEWQPAPGRIVAGHYRLLRSLGHGGMGAVWLAEVVSGEGLVALKWLRFDSAVDPELRARFRREIKAALAIRHPGIVHGVDLGRLPDGRDLLVMDYVDGPTLASVLADKGRTSHRAALNVGAQVACALSAAHANGFIHRDLKPSNIVLSDDAPLERARVRLLDLGICRDEGTPIGLSLTGEGTILGTPAYTAPEQLAGERISPRVDLYSLGVVLYRMVAGHPPFVGATFAEVLSAVLAADPAPLATVAPDPSRPYAFDHLVERMLAVDPNDRPADAREVESELRALENPRSRRVTLAALSLAASGVGALLGFLLGRA